MDNQTSGQHGTLLLFSNTVPTEESGSFVIFRRHLLPLVECGWQLKVFSYFPAPPGTIFWEHVLLPRRLPWWPPASPFSILSQRCRAQLMIRHLKGKHFVDASGPLVLLTNLWDYQAIFAAELARAGQAKLGVFIHDDEIIWNAGKQPAGYLNWRRRYVTDAASQIWSVSNRLAEQIDFVSRQKCRLLRPIPGNYKCTPATWRPEFGQCLHLGYAGKIYPGLLTLLQNLASWLRQAGGMLTVISDAESLAVSPASASDNISFRSYFARPDESLYWLAEHCSACIVAHPLTGTLPPGPWQALRTSFPSKLCEYAQTGLPLVLFGDSDSEFYEWSTQHTKLPFFTDSRTEVCTSYLMSLKTQKGWSIAALETARIRDRYFNPENMQRDFLDDIHSLTAP